MRFCSVTVTCGGLSVGEKPGSSQRYGFEATAIGYVRDRPPEGLKDRDRFEVIAMRRQGFVAVLVLLLGVLIASSPVSASVPPGTSVTDSSGKMDLRITVDGADDTVTCNQFTDTFVVSSGETTKATMPPPTIDECTDTLAPDQVDASIRVTTNSKNGSWKLQSGAGSTPCSGNCQMSLRIPKAGAILTQTIDPSCKVVLAPSGPDLVVGAYSPSAGTLSFDDVSVAMSGRHCTAGNPGELTMTVSFDPNLGSVPPFAS
jgi:hypothetical protein